MCPPQTQQLSEHIFANRPLPASPGKDPKKNRKDECIDVSNPAKDHGGNLPTKTELDRAAAMAKNAMQPVKPAIRRSHRRQNSLPQTPLYQNLHETGGYVPNGSSNLSSEGYQHNLSRGVAYQPLEESTTTIESACSSSCHDINASSSERSLPDTISSGSCCSSSSSQSLNSLGLGSRDSSSSSRRSPWLVPSPEEEDIQNLITFSSQDISEMQSSEGSLALGPLQHCPMSIDTSGSLEEFIESGLQCANPVSIVGDASVQGLETNALVEARNANMNEEFKNDRYLDLDVNRVSALKNNGIQEIVHKNGDIELLQIIEEHESFENQDCPPPVRRRRRFSHHNAALKSHDSSSNAISIPKTSASLGDENVLDLNEERDEECPWLQCSSSSFMKFFQRRSDEYKFSPPNKYSALNLSNSDILSCDDPSSPQLVHFSGLERNILETDCSSEAPSPSNPLNLISLTKSLPTIEAKCSSITYIDTREEFDAKQTLGLETLFEQEGETNLRHTSPEASGDGVILRHPPPDKKTADLAPPPRVRKERPSSLIVLPRAALAECRKVLPRRPMSFTPHCNRVHAAAAVVEGSGDALLRSSSSDVIVASGEYLWLGLFLWMVCFFFLS